MQHYAGIGSRQTPPPVLEQMFALAQQLARASWTLHSGGAAGADTAFEQGARAGHGRCIITQPYDDWYRDHDTRDAAMALAAQHHPNWAACSDFARRAHARNGIIVLGRNLQSPVHCIICWTPNGTISGGTGQALRLAQHYSIPVHNLALVSVTLSPSGTLIADPLQPTLL